MMSRLPLVLWAVVAGWAAAQSVPEPCETYFTDLNETCIASHQCQETSVIMLIYEDCSVGSTLFELVNDAWTEVCEGFILNARTVILESERDAENQELKTCQLFNEESILRYNVEDVNEFKPEPGDNGDYVLEKEFYEGEMEPIIFKYTDDDKGETESLKVEMVNNYDTFEVTSFYDKAAMVFTVTANKLLDYEQRSYYDLNFNIISSDSRGLQLNATQRVRVFVLDVGDNPPFWTQTVPSTQLPEGEAGRKVLQVQAIDRDTLGNAIKYTITAGNELGKFAIDENDGTVTTADEIDRESLDMTSFSLTISATEYLSDGTVAPDPNNSTQVTNIYITDINDNVPTFMEPQYSVTINELNGNDEYLSDLTIYVWDLDEGENGEFDIMSDTPGDLAIQPGSGRGNMSVSVRALWNGGNTIFDYEKGITMLSFTLTAQEKNNATKFGTTTLTINLTDTNDNDPVFENSVYEVDVNETAEDGLDLVTVHATDADVSDEFGLASIIYRSSCSLITVNNLTGEVTLIGGQLDYETSQTESCSVEAVDMLGEGKRATTTLKINVLDIVDEKPEIKPPGEYTIPEDATEGTQVGPVTATDRDEGANIQFDIDWANTKAYFMDATVDPSKVNGWFIINGTPTSSGSNQFLASVAAGPGIDREVADRVVLRLVVTDTNTQHGPDSDTTSMTINIQDVNDEWPQFEPLDVTEVKENIKSGTVVTRIRATDPDAGDTITLEISETGDRTLVSVEERPGTWTLEVAEGATIDYEVQTAIHITATLTDAAGHTSQEEIWITIIDLNDNAPVMDPETCNTVVEVAEDAETGYKVTTVRATDADGLESHRVQKYLLSNDAVDNLTPFAVNNITGEVTVLTEELRVLDRERKAQWSLTVVAVDGCGDGETDCAVITSDKCIITVDVTDVNDEKPEHFTLVPASTPWRVSEDLKAGDYVGDPAYTIEAKDLDEPGTRNSEVDYTVQWVHMVGDDSTDYDFFTAEFVPERGNCQLKAKTDLTRMKGSYEVLIKTEDRGTPTQTSQTLIKIIVTDANDNVPTFRFEGCLKDTPRQVTMEEKHYAAGAEVMCFTSDDDVSENLKIYVDDDDDGDNGYFNCDVDYDSSTAVTPDGGKGQLTSFEFKRVSDQCKLFVNDVINRELGSKYNLSLHTWDNGTPKQQSHDHLLVVVTDDFKSPPYFCTDGRCSDTILMIENHPDVVGSFMNATDDDNIDFDPDDEGSMQEVFYKILEGSNFFKLAKNTETRISLDKNKFPEGLDREAQDRYELQIFVTNDRTRLREARAEQNNTLYLTVVVQDENDNPPVFSRDTTVGSFTENDSKEKTIAELQVSDLDLNDNTTFEISTEFSWHGQNSEAKCYTGTEPAFIVDDKGVIKLNCDPSGLGDAYCVFNVTVEDGEGHQDVTEVKVYVITKKFQIPVTFMNNKNDVVGKEKEIEDIFTLVYTYTCVVDDITEISETTRSSPVTTAVNMHFINLTINEPVASETIIEMTNNINNIAKLDELLKNQGLWLESIGEEAVGSEDLNDKLILLQVLLAVVSLVLGSLVVLVLTAYCIRTRRLEHRVKVLSTNTFGSKDSDLNRLGLEGDIVPGSNMFKGEGANPMYNLDEADFNQDDNSSLSSGDSVLVGVEDNPEFRGYKGGSAHDNPVFARSIDQVSATRANPLFAANDSGEIDLADGLKGFELTLRRTSSDSDGSYGNEPDPNFSFNL